MVVYWGVQFQGSFGVYMLAYYLISMVSIALAYSIATLAPTMDAASAMLRGRCRVCDAAKVMPC